MQLESRLEASGAIAMGLDPRVRSLRSQPMTFDLATGRNYHSVDALQQAERLYGFRAVKYTPDFEVDLGNSKVLVEVKHRELINLNPKILSYPEILARFGYRLIIIDDVVLGDTFVQNLRLLNTARCTRSAVESDAEMVAFCGAGKSYGAFIEAGLNEAGLLRAVAAGLLTCDVRSARINHDTLIFATGDTSAHLKELPLVCR